MKKALLFLTLLLLPASAQASQAYSSGYTGKEVIRKSDCSGVKNEGQCCWDTDADTLCCGSGSACIAVGSGESGDSVTVNATAVDTTANLDDTATITWAVVDGGAGGPDDVRATAVDLTCTDCIGPTEITDSYVLNTGDTMTGDLTIDSSVDAALALDRGDNTRSAYIIFKTTGTNSYILGMDNGIHAGTSAFFTLSDGTNTLIDIEDKGTTADLTVTGKVISNGNLDVKNGATSSGVLAIFEDSDSGTNKATFQVPALAADTAYTLPANDGDADQFLQTNGSGTLTWATGSGSGDITSVGDVADGAAFDGTQGTTLTFFDAGGNATQDYDGTDITFSVGITAETLDTGNGAYELFAMDQDVETTDAVTFDTVDTGQGANELYAMDQDLEQADSPTFAAVTVTTEAYDESGWDADNTVPDKDAVRDVIEGLGGDNLTCASGSCDVDESYVMDGTPGTDHTNVGPKTVTFNAGDTITVMDLVYMASDGEWALTDADAASTATGILAVSLESQTDGNAMSVALPGSFVRDDTWDWTPGAILYIDTATAGAITATAPSGSADIVRVVGHAVTADVIFFNPDNSWVEIA